MRLALNESESIMWNGRVTDVPTSAVRSLKGRILRLGITQVRGCFREGV